MTWIFSRLKAIQGRQQDYLDTGTCIKDAVFSSWQHDMSW